MKNLKFIAFFATLALFGAGCSVTNKQTPNPQPDNNQVQVKPPVEEAKWLAYKDEMQGIAFNYPSTAKEVTATTKQNGYTDVIVSYDLGQTVSDPTAKSIPEMQLDVFKVKLDAKSQDGKPVINDSFYYENGWTPSLDLKVQRQTIGDYEFSRTAYSDAGAGNLYSTFAYTYPMGNNELVLFKFSIHSVNCGNYEGTGFKCISFDEARDTQSIKQILATAKLVPKAAVTYDFKDGVITSKTRYSEINVKYPVMNGARSSIAIIFNAKIKSFADAEVAQFKKDAQAAASYPGPGPWYINFYYKIPYNQNGLISVVMQKEEFTGGAHPNTTYKTFLYDTSTPKFLGLADIFRPTSDYLGAMAKYVKAELGNKLQQDGQPLADWFQTGTNPTTDNYKDFNLTDQGINFIFPPYQVAAYAYGTQEQVVPIDTFKMYILPVGPLKFWYK
jgi:hypothetical protein